LKGEKLVMKKIIKQTIPVILLVAVLAFMIGFKQDVALSSSEKQTIDLLYKKEEQYEKERKHNISKKKKESANSSNKKTSSKTYTVESGDTLSDIGVQFNKSVSELMSWNDISNP